MRILRGQAGVDLLVLFSIADAILPLFGLGVTSDSGSVSAKTERFHDDHSNGKVCIPRAPSI